jgi:hypothetical protein
MISNKEYFENPYYFFLKDKGDKVVLYYNYSNTLSEARKNDSSLEFKKSNRPSIKKKLNSIIKSKKHKGKKELDADLEDFKNKVETNELIDSDGSWSTSRIPILDPRVSPKGTTDQSIVTGRISNDPVTRGYRVYYGESKVNETDYSDAFGYEETKFMDGKETYNFFKEKMNLDPFEARERTLQQGKDPMGKRKLKAPKNIRKQKGFIDRLTLMETQRQQMIEMIEEIVKNKESEQEKSKSKEKNISKFLEKNLKSIKKIADKEGITINQLITYLKNNE